MKSPNLKPITITFLPMKQKVGTLYMSKLPLDKINLLTNNKYIQENINGKQLFDENILLTKTIVVSISSDYVKFKQDNVWELNVKSIISNTDFKVIEGEEWLRELNEINSLPSSTEIPVLIMVNTSLEQNKEYRSKQNMPLTNTDVACEEYTQAYTIVKRLITNETSALKNKIPFVCELDRKNTLPSKQPIYFKYFVSYLTPYLLDNEMKNKETGISEVEIYTIIENYFNAIDYVENYLTSRYTTETATIVRNYFSSTEGYLLKLSLMPYLIAKGKEHDNLTSTYFQEELLAIGKVLEKIYSKSEQHPTNYRMSDFISMTKLRSIWLTLDEENKKYVPR